MIYYGYQPYYDGIVRLGVIDGDVSSVAKDGDIKIKIFSPLTKRANLA